MLDGQLSITGAENGKPRYQIQVSSHGWWALEDHRFHAREASDSGETMRVALFTSGCSNEEPDSQTLGNDYSDEPCLGQEYQIITQINSDYARLLYTDPLDYELLATKGKNVC